MAHVPAMWVRQTRKTDKGLTLARGHTCRILSSAMKLRTPLSMYSATFLASLGLAPLSACGGSVNSDSRAGGATGTGGAGTGGLTSGGGHGPGGNTASGGLWAGGAAGTAGSLSTGGVPTWATGGVPAWLPCSNPAPLPGPDGTPTGYVTCDGGSVHRSARMDCPSVVPRAAACQPYVSYDAGIGGGCTHDSDCTAQANGYCVPGIQFPGCVCDYGCIRDSDCAQGQICECGNPAGKCVSATCTSDQDCGQGLCLSYEAMPGCGMTAFACQKPGDTCVSNADCTAQGGMCGLASGLHVCQPISCAIGRPFLVQGEPRLAHVETRADWASAAAPDVAELTAEARASLAARWAEIALMEHASIAAFARFALELLSLGAPPELLARTQQAMQDETLHARDAFALASRYAGAPVGPGALAIEGSVSSRSPLEIVATAILEGCIGETVAAVEAAECLAHASDPAVREVLSRVARDETRHAELAWQFVRWVLAEGPVGLRRTAASVLTGVVRAEIERSTDGFLDVEEPAADPLLRAHGVLDLQTRAEIRRQVLAEIIGPCARALVAGVQGRGPSRSAGGSPSAEAASVA